MNPDDWRELHRTADRSLAWTIVTTIEAMEFDVRLIDAHTRQPIDDDEAASAGPYAVEVRPDDADELRDVLDELIGEQVEFDASLAARRSRDRVVRAIAGALLVLAALAYLWLRFGR